MTSLARNLPRNCITPTLGKQRLAWLLLAGLAILPAAWLLWTCRHALGDLLLWLNDREAVQTAVQSFGPLGPLALALGQVVQVLVTFIPGQILLLAGGYIYGFLPGLALNLLSTVLASQLAFGVARRAGRPLAERLASPALLARMDGLMSRHGPLFLVISFIAPFVPGDTMNLVAGLSLMPGRRFLALNILGRLPGAVVMTFIGAYGLARPRQAWIAIALIALAAAGIWIIANRQSRLPGSRLFSAVTWQRRTLVDHYKKAPG